MTRALPATCNCRDRHWCKTRDALHSAALFCDAFSCPFNCRNENGTLICGATKSVCTNKTVPRNASTPKMSNARRNRGQRLPAGSEKTNGVSAPGGTSCMSRLFSLTACGMKEGLSCKPGVLPVDRSGTYNSALQTSPQLLRVLAQQLRCALHVFLIAHSRPRVFVNAVKKFAHFSIFARPADHRENALAQFARQFRHAGRRFSFERLSIQTSLACYHKIDILHFRFEPH